MTTFDNQSLVGPQLTALADALETQPVGVADLPSLCEGWAVRHVLAHMTMAARYDGDAFQAELAKASFDFPTLLENVARRDGELAFERLVADLRSATMADWAPPGGGAAGALSHAVIHGLDITSAVGLHRSASDEAARQVLVTLTEGGVHQHFGTQVEGVALVASDIDWSYGSGRTVEAESADLILALAGRQRPTVNLA
ncbi:MAG: maleylpyruvate isomerase family mycothiol-dependent enzyme [Aeromicrobium sp.]